MLELLMKKSVKIMRNPLVMKDAFRRFNFTKYVYTNDGKGDIEVEEVRSNDTDDRNKNSNIPLSASDGTSDGSPRRMTTIEDATSERLPSRSLNNQNLIKVEAYMRKENHDRRRRTSKQSYNAIKNASSKKMKFHKTMPLSGLASPESFQSKHGKKIVLSN